MTQEKKEIVSVGLSEKTDQDRPGIVEEMLVDLREALPGLFVDLSQSGRTWLRGKSAQETAKAQQILSDVIDRIGRLKLDEREQCHRHDLENAQQHLDFKQRQMELYLSSLERATKIVKDLSEVGVDVDITAILNGTPVHIDSISQEPPESNLAPISE